MRSFDLGQKVEFIRVDPEGNPVRGNGIIVSKLVGIAKRINYSVKEGDKAWNLEPYAIDGTELEEQIYLRHVKEVRAKADEYNAKAQAMITEGNKAIDDMNTALFGPPMDL